MRAYEIDSESFKNNSLSIILLKISQLAYLPQGVVEAKERTKNLVKQMDNEGFGSCSFTTACESACPQEISIANIAKMNS